MRRLIGILAICAMIALAANPAMWRKERHPQDADKGSEQQS